jgi:hypothetical protein
MGLTKQMKTRFGDNYNVNYWTLRTMNVGKRPLRGHFVMLGYGSRDEMIAGGDHLDSRTFDFPRDDQNFTLDRSNGADSLEKQMYLKIKAQTKQDGDGNEVPGDFADAVDVFEAGQS